MRVASILEGIADGITVQGARRWLVGYPSAEALLAPRALRQLGRSPTR
jgi:hypothetical protein